MNIQFAIKKEDGRQVLYVLEVNPRASRTVPFVSKATGMPVAKVAAKVMAGVSLAEQGIDADPIPAHVSVKESVFPFAKFAGVDIVLGPGDAIDRRGDGRQRAVLDRLCQEPIGGRHSAAQEGHDLHQRRSPAAKEHMSAWPRGLAAMGFQLLATDGTARVIEAAGIPVEHVKKLQEGHPNLIDYLIDGQMQLIMNTPSGKGARTDEGRIRAAAVAHGVPCITTIPAADACVKAMEALREEEMTVQALQDRFPQVESPLGASSVVDRVS